MCSLLKKITTAATITAVATERTIIVVIRIIIMFL
jgi:hypothetical protein